MTPMADDPIDINVYRAEKENDAWRDDLQLSNHKPIGNEYNVHLALTECPAFKGKIAFDLRLFKPVLTSQTPAGHAGEWTDAYTSRTAIWLQAMGIQAKPRTIDSALLAVAHGNEIDPLERWLYSIEWDGQERIGTFFHHYLGAEETLANSVMGSKFLIGACARACKPGCRMDVMPVLEGPQGARKSTVVKILGGDYAGENLPDFHSKDAMLIVGAKWIVEVPELAAVRKSDIEHIKAFISRTEDTFRPPYGRYNITQPRRCVLIGNLNPDGNGYLQDSTGNRRFWPVRVGVTHPIDIELLKADRTQIWAEAMHCFMRGDRWWLEGDETAHVAEVQQERMMEDPWAAALESWAMAKVGTFTTADIAKGALDIDIENVNRSVSTRIGIILKDLPLAKRRVREGSALSWRYFKSEDMDWTKQSSDVPTD